METARWTAVTPWSPLSRPKFFAAKTYSIIANELARAWPRRLKETTFYAVYTWADIKMTFFADATYHLDVCVHTSSHDNGSEEMGC